MNDGCAGALVGRAARLELAFEARGGRTVVAHAYAEPPFRVGRSFDVDGAAYVILVCCGPGVFAGDELQQSVHVARGARVMMTSQSALQVHPSAATTAARVHQQYTVDAGAELHCHWDAVIPFSRARLEQRFDIRLHASSRLYWSDALMSGRVERGERWQFDEIGHELRLAVDDRLTYLERYRVRPLGGRESTARDPYRSPSPLQHPWVCGAANYFSTLLIHDNRATAAAAEALHRTLSAVPRTAGAVDAVEPGLIVGRLTASDGGPFASGRATLRHCALEAIFEKPNLLLRK